MRSKRLTLIFMLLLSFVLVNSVMAMDSPNYAIDWMVPMSGGGGHAVSANYAVDFTYGQTAIGVAQSSGFQTSFGFWHGIPKSVWDLFMPLIIRD